MVLLFSFSILVTAGQFINIETFPGWLELPSTGTSFYCPKPVRATEVLLYADGVANR